MASDLPYWSQVPVQSRDCTVIMHWWKSWLETTERENPNQGIPTARNPLRGFGGHLRDYQIYVRPITPAMLASRYLQGSKGDHGANNSGSHSIAQSIRMVMVPNKP
jgi:hypothetical protein